MFLLIIRRPAVATEKNLNVGILCVKEKATNLLRCFSPPHFLKTCLQMRLLTATMLALIIAGPWYVLVGQRTGGEFLRSFFLKENFGRAMTAMEGHSGGPLFYIITVLVGFFPCWSRESYRMSLQHQGLRVLSAWSSKEFDYVHLPKSLRVFAGRRYGQCSQLRK